MTEKYDAIVVGAGAGGGIAAGVLAEAGKRVLLLERGEMLSFAQIGRDHLRNHRLAQYGHNTGPELDGNPRVAVSPNGYAQTVNPIEGGYQNNAMTVGGGTRVYGGQAWRFHPLDFRMATTYGVPAGSSLADWPISFDDLAPFYERAEWEIGVAGDASQMTHLPPYAKPYPLPPTPVTRTGTLLRQAADSLGWDAFPLPLLINTVPRNGRAACVHCQHCVGFGCPTDAKNGSQNTLLPRALATGNCELVTGAQAEKVETDGAGRINGVTYRDSAGERKTARAEVVILAAGAIETARLLLLSGLGNENVGQNLQGHYYGGATGLMPDDMYDGLGPGASTATARFSHGNDGIIGGGMLADEFILLPIIFWKAKTPPDLPRWGLEAKRWMRDNYRRVIDIRGPIQEIPSSDARVALDLNVTDKYGLPAARLSGTAHPESARACAFLSDRAAEWLRAAGATDVWGVSKPGLYLSAGQHQAGTCRMGDDPQTSVVDRHCRVHGHDNLYVADGSVHVTNGGFNPVLTIMALAFRTAQHVAQSW